MFALDLLRGAGPAAQPGGKVTPWRRVLGTSLLVGAAACTPFESGSDELLDKTSAELPLPDVGGDWSCLQEDSPPSMLVASRANAARLVQSIQILSLISETVIPGVVVRACAQRDVDCIAPLTAPMPLDADGWIDVPLYEGFDGFLEITGPTLLSTALFYAKPITPGAEVYASPVGLVEKARIASLSGATGTPQDPEFGLVVLRTFDCQGNAAPGIEFSIDKPGTPYYFVGGLPSSEATATSDTGLGGYINVEPGTAVVSAARSGGIQPVAAPTSVLVRAGWMTAIRFVPRLP